MKKVQFPASACECPDFLVPSIQEMILSPLYTLGCDAKISVADF